MVRIKFLTLGASISFALAAALAPLKHPLNENPPDSKPGPMRNALATVAQNWIAKPRLLQPVLKSEKARQVDLVCFETPGMPGGIGIGQSMTINVSIDQVRKVIEDFDHYKDIFFTFKEVTASDFDGNRLITHWEESIPIPFTDNTKYSTYFYIDNRNSDHAFYRYQLRESNSLKYSDGLIVLDRLNHNDAKNTRYTEYDFYDGSAAPSVMMNRVWRDSLREIYYSDIAIKLKSEHPDWDYKNIRIESKRLWSEEYSDDHVNDLISAKKSF